jgi:hypothetical protein
MSAALLVIAHIDRVERFLAMPAKLRARILRLPR